MENMITSQDVGLESLHQSSKSGHTLHEPEPLRICDVILSRQYSETTVIAATAADGSPIILVSREPSEKDACRPLDASHGKSATTPDRDTTIAPAHEHEIRRLASSLRDVEFEN